ncbi:MAG: TolC family protein [Treponema sp.]|jgi:outer membrane protein TolC|nr:TolC family protein [Treponema sp.]
MKKFFIALCLSLLYAAGVFSDDYDLKKYLAFVEANNADIQAAHKDAQIAAQTARQALSALLPGAGFQAGYDRNLTDDMRPAAVGSLPGGGPLIYQDVDQNYDNQLTLGIGVQQKLLDPQAIATYSKARKGREIRETALEAARQNVLCAAKKLYAQTRLALTVVGIRESSENLSREICESAERRYRTGTATELDVLISQVDWKSKITDTAEARKNAALVLSAFKNLAGIPLAEDVRLTEVFDESPLSIPGLTEDGSYIAGSTITGGSLAKRPDFQALVMSKQLADISKKSAYSTFAPTISAGFSWGWAGMGNDTLTGDYDTTSSKLSVTATIPLFAGGARIAAVKAAGLEQEKAALALRRKQQDIERQFIELRLRFTEAKERFESAKSIEEMAGRAVALAQSAYTNGAGTRLSVSDAQDKLDKARLGLENALFEYHCVYYDWELATGNVR